jgi:hypothetical protein
MKVRGAEAKQHADGKTAPEADTQSRRIHKASGVFVNSVCTSSEPLFRETIRIKLTEPAKAK